MLQKRLFFLSIALMLFVSFTVFAEDKKESKEEKFNSGYGSYVKALRQFPYPYILTGGRQLWTLTGSQGISQLEEKDFKYFSEKYDNDNDDWIKELRYITLRLVSKNDKQLNIKIVATEIDLKIFLHELNSRTGKYKFWNPVILFPVFEDKRISSDALYWIRDVDIVGRFFIHESDTWIENPNNETIYENEVYYR